MSRLDRILSRFSAVSPRLATREYAIGDVKITLPRSHQLPTYQAHHPLYDRFLPVLASSLPDDGRWIIDVGANVGDTAVALQQSTRSPILAVEGDPRFFEMLQLNVAPFRDQIAVAQALVGTGAVNGALVQNGSTATRSTGPEAPSNISLDDLLRRHAVSLDNVSLLKTDTDGFDADVILSAKSTIMASKPLLFWENEFRSASQRRELESIYRFLAEQDYEAVWIFDNLGFPIHCETRFDTLLQINDYVDKMMQVGRHRSIYYTDILAATGKDINTARAAIVSYQNLLSSMIGQ